MRVEPVWKQWQLGHPALDEHGLAGADRFINGGERVEHVVSEFARGEVGATTSYCPRHVENAESASALDAAGWNAHPNGVVGTFEEFEAIWRWDEWNHFSIRCIGDCPTVTVRINGLLVAELDLARLKAENFDPQVVMSTLGTQGHIAFEVHDNDPGLGAARWAPDAACRWRNVQIRELP